MKTQKLTSIRLVNGIQVINGCWEWQLGKSADGYGQTFTWDGTSSSTVRAHRLAYETFIGPIPKELVLDHLCRNKICINPDHLEPVTVKENTRRGKVGILKTHCSKGHKYTKENVVFRADKRSCRRCSVIRQKRARLMKRRTNVNTSA